jgi:hypothetical protein
MPVATRSKTELKPISEAEWKAVEALLLLKHTVKPEPKGKRPQRTCATYSPGTFAGME